MEKDGNKEEDAADRHENGKDLRYGKAAAEDILPVAQRLHDGAHRAVGEEIPGDGKPVRLFAEIPHQREQERKDDDIEHALIEEEGVMPLPRTLDVDAEGEPLPGGVGDDAAVDFLIEEVAPPADALR